MRKSSSWWKDIHQFLLKTLLKSWTSPPKQFPSTCVNLGIQTSSISGYHQLSELNKTNRVQICEWLLERHQKLPFFDQMITCDEKSIYYDNVHRQKHRSKPDERTHTVAKRVLTNKKVLLSVWWDQRGIIFYDFLPSGKTVDGDVYRGYLDFGQPKRSYFSSRQRQTTHSFFDPTKDSKWSQMGTFTTSTVFSRHCTFRLLSLPISSKPS